MIVKKKSEEAERKRAYTKRVLELLYPEEHASSVSSVDSREGSSAASESQIETTSHEGISISALEVSERAQLKQKIYGVSSPPADVEMSSCQDNLQAQTEDMQHSSSEEQELFNDDPSSTRRRRRHKRRKTSHNQPTTSSADTQPCSTVSQSKVAETVKATESLSRNRKRKLKKKLKLAERKHSSSEFVYKDIHETRTENISSETHDAGKL